MMFFLNEADEISLNDKSGLDNMDVSKRKAGEDDEANTDDTESSTPTDDSGTDTTSENNGDDGGDAGDGSDPASDPAGDGGDATGGSAPPTGQMVTLETETTVVYNNIVELGSISDRLLEEVEDFGRSAKAEQRKTVNDVQQSIEQTNSKIKRLLVQFPRLSLTYSQEFYGQLKEIIESDARAIEQLIDNKAKD